MRPCPASSSSRSATRDELTGKWVRARYVAERLVIAARFTEWEIIGPPEIRNPEPDAGYFTPWKVEKTREECIANLGPIIELAGWAVVPHRPIRVVDRHNDDQARR